MTSSSYPHSDIWPHYSRMIKAFTPDRVMWASDFSRLRNYGRDYADELHLIRDTNELSNSDKEKILGKTVRHLLRWPAPAGACRLADRSTWTEDFVDRGLPDETGANTCRSSMMLARRPSDSSSVCSGPATRAEEYVRGRSRSRSRTPEELVTILKFEPEVEVRQPCDNLGPRIELSLADWFELLEGPATATELWFAGRLKLVAGGGDVTW